ncbi:MAG: hypothetical protein ACK5IP_07035 [Paracoccus sp. (in: a-proteobacteria)]
MTAGTQKRLAIVAALAVAILFVAANAHLIVVALRSQPDCTLATGAMPARRAC